MDRMNNALRILAVLTLSALAFACSSAPAEQKGSTTQHLDDGDGTGEQNTDQGDPGSDDGSSAVTKATYDPYNPWPAARPRVSFNDGLPPSSECGDGEYC
jgi:hypothetical protein